jgi:hypothetical protein
MPGVLGVTWPQMPDVLAGNMLHMVSQLCSTCQHVCWGFQANKIVLCRHGVKLLGIVTRPCCGACVHWNPCYCAAVLPAWLGVSGEGRCLLWVLAALQSVCERKVCIRQNANCVPNEQRVSCLFVCSLFVCRTVLLAVVCSGCCWGCHNNGNPVATAVAALAIPGQLMLC